MAIAQGKENQNYSANESVRKFSTTIDESEYQELARLDISYETEVGNLRYLDIYDGEGRNQSALTSRVIAGDEPYHLTVTYHKMADLEPDKEAFEPVEDIVGEIDVESLLE